MVIFGDIIDELGILRLALRKNHIELGKDEKEVCDYVYKYGETATDSLCRSTGRLSSDIKEMVTILEMKGLLQTT